MPQTGAAPVKARVQGPLSEPLNSKQPDTAQQEGFLLPCFAWHVKSAPTRGYQFTDDQRSARVHGPSQRLSIASTQTLRAVRLPRHPLPIFHILLSIMGPQRGAERAQLVAIAHLEAFKHLVRGAVRDRRSRHAGRLRTAGGTSK